MFMGQVWLSDSTLKVGMSLEEEPRWNTYKASCLYTTHFISSTYTNFSQSMKH